MLDAPPYGLAYSNFWTAKDDLVCIYRQTVQIMQSCMQGHHVSDDLYYEIIERSRVGCFSCPLVFGAVLVHLASPYSENLAYHPPHPRFIGHVNDVKQFAFSAMSEGQCIHTCRCQHCLLSASPHYFSCTYV